MKTDKVDGKWHLNIFFSSKTMGYAFAEGYLPKLHNKCAAGELLEQEIIGPEWGCIPWTQKLKTPYFSTKSSELK